VSFGTSGSNSNGGQYFYDGDGKRVKKIVGAETTVFVYNASGQMVEEYSRATPTQNPTTSYLTTDTLGTPRINTDASGQVKARHDYLPFGEEIIGLSGRTTTQGYSVADGVRQKFTSYERDNESGLDFAQNRYYSSALGRFTSPDEPFVGQDEENPQTWNLYAYTSNNPLVRVDLDGKRWFYKNIYDENGNLINRDVQWVNPNEDGTYTSPGEGWVGFIPAKERPELTTCTNGTWNACNRIAYLGENADGSPTVRNLWTGRVEDASEHIFAALLAGRILSAIRGAVTAYRAWKVVREVCFVAGTPVWTKDGLKPIEEIRVSDEVLSYNEKTEQIEYKAVVKAFKKFSEEILSVSIEGETEPLGVTPNHPFYVRVHQARDNTNTGDDDEGEWLEARKLKVGNQVKLASGSWARVLKIERQSGGEAVYNFEAADNHNYFVGQIGLLVHNTGDCLPVVNKAVNSKLPHAVTQALERGFPGNREQAANALRELSNQITQNGFPQGTIRDTARADRVLVPLNDRLYAVYQVAANGTAKLQTVLIKR
jgi:RHS repeat-associated protein